MARKLVRWGYETTKSAAERLASVLTKSGHCKVIARKARKPGWSRNGERGKYEVMVPVSCKRLVSRG